MGRLSRGVVDSHLDTYHHLGDASTQTDNKIYDPSMKPYQTDGIHSGTPDDRWVFVEDSPATSYLGMGALAAASRALRGFNDPLATECLALAKKAYADEHARAAAAQPGGPEQGFARFAELTAVLQLVLSTKEQPYIDRFNELLWPALDRAPAFTLQTAVRAMPAMDAAYATKLRPYVERYRATLDGMDIRNGLRTQKLDAMSSASSRTDSVVCVRSDDSGLFVLIPFA